MANKNHPSAQLGMEQRILLYASTEMQVFLDLHAIIYNQDVCDLQTRIGMSANVDVAKS